MASETKHLEDEKLRLEIAKLKQDRTPTGRFSSTTLPTLVSVTTAIVAVAGITISLYTLYIQGTQQAKDNHDKLLQQALSMATEGNAQNDRRISGIYQLGSFWDNPGDELVLAATLTALVISDQKDADVSSVRCAAAAVIGAALEPSATNKTKEPERAHIARLLYGPAGIGDKLGSLGLLTRQNNILRRKQDWSPIKNDSNTKTLDCETPLAATREAIRKGYAYLASTNFHDNDLSYTRLYQADLQGAELIGAQLIGTNLRCANLLDANMERAVLNKFEDDKSDVAMTDTRLANVDKAKLAKMHADASPKEGSSLDTLFTHTISLSPDDWREWQKGDFTISVLKRLLGPNINVSGYSERFCHDGRLENNSKLVP